MASGAFSRDRRLLKRADFLDIQQNGLRLRTPHLLACYRQRRWDVGRVGLTVSRKVGNAVTRNRVKRWLREVIRPSLPVLSAVDLVIIARSSSVKAGFHVLCRDMTQIVNRLSNLS